MRLAGISSRRDVEESDFAMLFRELEAAAVVPPVA